jgi:hypothetical protein
MVAMHGGDGDAREVLALVLRVVCCVHRRKKEEG